MSIQKYEFINWPHYQEFKTIQTIIFANVHELMFDIVSHPMRECLVSVKNRTS